MCSDPTYTALFETDRLLVREFTATDLDDFATLCADPRVMHHVGDGAGLNRTQVQHWIDVCQIKYRERGYGTSAVFEKATGDFVGYCGVVRASDRDYDEITYVFTQNSWGRGYATEVGRRMLDYVFQLSSLTKIWATIDADNTDSIKVARKLGMSFVKSAVDGKGSKVVYLVRYRA